MTAAEQETYRAYMAGLPVPERKTPGVVAIAMIGLVGAGKSTFAREMSEHIGAAVIEGDALRAALRAHRLTEGAVRIMAELAARDVLRRGGNIILASDFAEPEKREHLRIALRGTAARLLFIRVYNNAALPGILNANLDILIGRLLSHPYDRMDDDFFTDQHTLWQGSDQERGAVIKLRSMVRRFPWHYHWTPADGGTWRLRALPFKVFAEIDTTHPWEWATQFRDCRERLLAL